MKVSAVFIIGIFILLFIYLVITSKDRSKHLGKFIIGCIALPGLFIVVFVWETLSEISVKDIIFLKRITEVARTDAEEIKK